MSRMSSSRHMGCKTCRDRKVRCPGEQPTCEKCKRSGDTCVYVSPSKQSKADIALTIESLQERLAKAEAQLKEAQQKEASQTLPPDSVIFDPMNGLGGHSPFQSSAIGFNMHRPQSSSFSEGLHTPPASFSDGDTQMSDLMALVSPISSLSPPPDVTDATAFFDSFPGMVSPTPLVGNCRAQNDVSIQPSPFPSLRDLRALNASPHHQLQQPNLDGSAEPSQLVQELAALSSSVRLAQADAAGVASALAEYLGWAKKFLHSNVALVFILETLEARAREISVLCSANSTASLERLANALGNSEDAMKLQADEKKIQNKLLETAEFFQSCYDIQAPLAVQRRP